MKIIKYIPDTITCLNLLSGSIAVIFAFRDDFDMALAMIVLAAVFDFLDGMAARALHAYSDIGKELDSLSDAVSFGLAPSLILFNYLDGFPSSCIRPFICYIPLLIAAFSALRLAKFNLDTRQTESFLGLPGTCLGPLCCLSGRLRRTLPVRSQHHSGQQLHRTGRHCNPLCPSGKRTADVFDETQNPPLEGQRTAFHISVHNNTRRSHPSHSEDPLDGYRIHCLCVLYHLERSSRITPKTASQVVQRSPRHCLPWPRNRT